MLPNKAKIGLKVHQKTKKNKNKTVVDCISGSQSLCYLRCVCLLMTSSLAGSFCYPRPLSLWVLLHSNVCCTGISFFFLGSRLFLLVQ